MKRFALLGALMLAGCAPYSGYYRAGATTGAMEAALTECQVAAVQRVPPNTQLRRTPILQTQPARVYCKDDRCIAYPARYAGGRAYTTDVNAGLRGRVVRQCMAREGYRPVTVPLCGSDVPEALRRTAQTRMPPLGPNVCSVRGQDGRYGFVVTG
ncbi:putative lipoprotein [Oceaniovalibus guishaninsula JLT2003]|uniref:Putative lipoprotein n=1 Tax=Oceaniovalibus guishaninsula JLT2003 TaxID=1231392 RepID=K2H7I5_9RHOB|nr:hypothetical protein [Oceaniovalibus guishaninsula]EKE43578.1 putative lipoprotein [Oceaniovalibus guishaninsula JLT2003]